MGKETPILKVENLSIYKSGKKILNNLNLSIKKGEMFGILGSNGAGKSSLAYAIMGLKNYSINSGKILYEGRDITKWSITERAKKGIALSWQEPIRFEGLKVKEYLEIGIKDKYNKRNKCGEYLKLFGLNPDLYLDRIIDETLSGGERKRIELASIFLSEPKLIILDEPDSGIDIHGIENIKKVLKNTKSYNTTLLLITHQKEIADISDRIAIICDGSIEKIGETKETLGYFKKCEKCMGKTFV